MISLKGYQITELIYSGVRTQVYRGHRISDHKLVIVKVLRTEYPSFGQLLQFQHQYTITKNLNIDQIIHPYCLEKYYHSLALVMEDFGGISLKEWMRQWGETGMGKNRSDLQEFLQIGIKITHILAQLHKERIIHKDIKPANILINPTTKQIKLTDFSIASLLPKETQNLVNPHILEGTLGYISPEQTGRMNRAIDYRTDFYALGITFYELLTGQLPFTSTDPLELIHCHIAKPSPLVSALNPDIPPIIDRIVHKLMAKNAEDRYQSALGIKADLEICLQDLETLGKISDFSLGKKDKTERFIIPEKLYGRTQEVDSLLKAFDRISNDRKSQSDRTFSPKNQCELILIAGYSGIGKTAVVNEIHKPIVKQNAYFIKGKFDQYQRDIPLLAIMEAFRDLTQQLLSENTQQIASWRSQILSAVGDDGQILVNIIPELELLIGKQPKLANLDAGSAQNRFNLVLQKFSQTLSSEAHPLVIFLDDLQWADWASLNFLQLWLTSSESHHLLIIGAYRDHEVYPTHPLMITLEEMRQKKVKIETITLTPLKPSELNHLIADTLLCSSELALPLTQIVYSKTQGNPFFTHQFLQGLYADGLISFQYPETDQSEGGWECDLSQIKNIAFVDDVVEFMAIQLQKLPTLTQEVLKLAACIGNQFDLPTLAIVCEKSLTDTAHHLWRSIQAELILPTNQIYKFYLDTTNSIAPSLNNYPLPTTNDALPTYKFAHDRIQQAAYSLISITDKESTHLKIGRLLLQHIPPAERALKIFEIVNQLNLGKALITDEKEREQLAELNLIAGQKALATTAYNTAIKSAQLGINLLAQIPWQNQYNLTLNLFELAAQAYFLNSNFAELEIIVKIVQKEGKSLLDKIKCYELEIVANILQGKQVQGVKLCWSVLELLGVEMPSNPTSNDAVKGLEEINKSIGERSIASLIDLPLMTEPNYLAAMRLLSNIWAAVYFVAPEFLPFVALTMVKLSLKYGNALESPVGYIIYGVILVCTREDIETAYQYGQLALSLLERLNAKQFTAKVLNLFASFLQYWHDSLRQASVSFLTGYKNALATGDLEYMGYCINCYIAYLLLAGKELNELSKSIALYGERLEELNQYVSLHGLKIYGQVTDNLLGKSANPFELIGAIYDESKELPKLQETKNFMIIGLSVLWKVTISYILCEYDRTRHLLAELANYQLALTGLVYLPIINFYESLSSLAIFDNVTQSEQAKILEKIQLNQSKMARWAQQAPMNFRHKYDLVEAEKYRVLGNQIKAMEMYDQAIKLAEANAYLHEEALAYELAGKFYLIIGKELIAKTYLTNAYYAYARWGAKVKIDDLAQRYPELLEPILQQENPHLSYQETITSATISPRNTASSPPTTSSVSEILDLQTVIKTSQTLSAAMQIDDILSILMQAVMENAGASKAVLILIKDDGLEIGAIANIIEDLSTPVMPKKNLAASAWSSPILTEGAVVKLPQNVINYVKNTQETLLVDNVIKMTPSLANDPYIKELKPQSILCTPMLYQGQAIGILYLENKFSTGAFTQDRLELLNVLCAQAAISIENAKLYQKSQNYADRLATSLAELQQAQLQIIQAEKMAGVGQLMAGIAHEINNPLGCIDGNLDNLLRGTKDLLDHLSLYQEKLADPGPEIADHAENIELEYLQTDLLEMIRSMQQGTDRIKEISNSLRVFTRSDLNKKVKFNLHEGIDSTLVILKHRLKANSQRPAIEVIKEYGKIALIDCYPGQLNQVFMNILANAIDALEETNQGKTYQEIVNQPNRLTIKTRLENEEKSVIISISDNGKGIPPEIKAQIFDYLFTTKEVGKGTGLGLAIARQIIIDKHGGNLSVNSTVGAGTEFVITLPVFHY